MNKNCIINQIQKDLRHEIFTDQNILKDNKSDNNLEKSFKSKTCDKWLE